MADRASGQDPAHERIAEILRTALSHSDDAPIEDETRRLMLHLSLERPQPPELPAAPPLSRPGLLRQMLRRAGKKGR